MTIDNGRQLQVVIPGVFEGLAGESDGVLALIPNRKGKRGRYAREGEVEGQPVRLTFVAERPPFVTYRWGPVE
jgi:hypothetical protein